MPPSTMYEHGEPSKGFPMEDLDSEDKDENPDALNTLWDEEIVYKLFDDLNRDLLGLPGDDKVIVINNSGEEDREDNHANADVAPSSLRVSLTPSASTIDDDGTPDGGVR
jgi:hypothetical protein